MYAKSALVFAIAGTAFARPQATVTEDDFNLVSMASSVISKYATETPTATDLSQVSTYMSEASSYLNDASAIVSELSGIPTLASSIEAALSSVIPDSDSALTEAFCSPTAASWYSSLGTNEQAALTSYVAAFQTWVASKDGEEGGLVPPIPSCGAQTTTTASVGTTLRPSNNVTRSATATLSTSTFPGAAPTNGAIMSGIAGIVGIFGVMIAL